MDFQLDKRQAGLRDAIREFARQELAPRAGRTDEEGRYDPAVFAQLAEMKLLAPLLPPEAGGAGVDYLSCAIIVEELSRACASTTLSYGAHAFLCTHNLHTFGTDEQKKRYLPRLASGGGVGAFAVTEPEAGSDALSIRTTVREEKGGFRISGKKTLITNGPVADIFIVAARMEGTTDPGGLGLFIVEKSFKGFSAGSDIPKLGMRGSPTSELVLTDCPVPAENRLGRPGEAIPQLMRALDVERAIFSGMPVGIAQAAFDVARSYAVKRQQFGKKIAQFELVQAMIAEMAVGIDAARLLTYRAARLLDEGRPATKEASMAKLFGAEMVMKATVDAVQILGGHGYTKWHPVERLMRDAKLISIGGGSNQIQQLIIAKEIFKGES